MGRYYEEWELAFSRPPTIRSADCIACVEPLFPFCFCRVREVVRCLSREKWEKSAGRSVPEMITCHTFFSFFFVFFFFFFFFCGDGEGSGGGGGCSRACVL